MKHLFLSLICCATVLFSCSTKENSSSAEHTVLDFEITDSLRIPYLGRLNLMDVSPAYQRTLFFDFQDQKFVISDFQGGILGEFSNDRDSPNGFGSFPMAAGKFISDSTFQLVTSYGIFEYNFEGNLVSSTRVPRDEVQPFSGRGDAKREIEFVQDKILLTGLVARGEYNKTEPEFYDTFLQLVWADPKTGEFERFLPLDPESIFQNNMSHEPVTLSATFEVVNDRLMVITGSDPFLNMYELQEPYNRISRIPLDLTDYRLNPGEDPKKADPRAISYDPSYGIIIKMASVGDYLVLAYETGYDELDAQRSSENRTPEEWQEFNDYARKKYRTRFQILDLDGNLLSDFKMPKGLSDYFLSRDGALWFMKEANPEEEEDFFTLYKVDIN